MMFLKMYKNPYFICEQNVRELSTLQKCPKCPKCPKMP